MTLPKGLPLFRQLDTLEYKVEMDDSYYLRAEQSTGLTQFFADVEAGATQRKDIKNLVYWGDLAAGLRVNQKFHLLGPLCVQRTCHRRAENCHGARRQGASPKSKRKRKGRRQRKRSR